MRLDVLLLLLFVPMGWASDSLAFVHISQRKPRLPVSPALPTVTFYWDGDSPVLRDKEDVMDGIFAEASDRQLMEVLLVKAMNTWNAVDTSYLDFQLQVDPDVPMSNDDGIFAIRIENQESKSVAAAAQPNFDDEGRDGRNGKTIFDCDISISRSKVSAKDLLRTLTHELGHCVGLGHPHSNYHSIMSYSSISDSAELGLDDKAGVTFLYPEDDISQDVRYLTACGVVGGGGAAGILLMVLPLALPLFGAGRKWG
jgi:hypothetical protein